MENKKVKLRIRKKRLALLIGILALFIALVAVIISLLTKTASEEGSQEEPEAEVVEQDFTFEIIVVDDEPLNWQAVTTGAQSKAEELGITCKCTIPEEGTTIEEQVAAIYAAIEVGCDGIGLATTDSEACLEAIEAAAAAGIPVVCFNSSIADATEGAISATVTSDDYGDGATAASYFYNSLKSKLESAEGQVRIGVLSQNATSAYIINRTLGFIDKIVTLADSDGLTVAVSGNEYYSEHSMAFGDEETADIIIEASIPAQATVELCAIEARVIMIKDDTIGMFATSQIATEGMLSTNAELNLFGTDNQIIAAGYESGATIIEAISAEILVGAMTVSLPSMTQRVIELLCEAAKGNAIDDYLVQAYWYNLSNMNDASIEPNLYE